MKIPLVIQPIVQVGQADCGIAAVAMYLGIPYRTVSDAALRVAPRAHAAGLWMSELRRVIRALGQEAALMRDPERYEDGDGVLVLGRGRVRHFAVQYLGGSAIVDPANGCVWDPTTFLASKKWKIYGLLQ